MAKIYARLCEKGEKNFFDVPKKLRNQVREIIESDGFTINDDGTVVPENNEKTYEFLNYEEDDFTNSKKTSEEC